MADHSIGAVLAGEASFKRDLTKSFLIEANLSGDAAIEAVNAVLTVVAFILFGDASLTREMEAKPVTVPVARPPPHILSRTLCATLGMIHD